MTVSDPSLTVCSATARSTAAKAPRRAWRDATVAGMEAGVVYPGMYRGGHIQGGTYPPWSSGTISTMVHRDYTHHGTQLGYPPWYIAGIPTMEHTLGIPTMEHTLGIPTLGPELGYPP